MVVVFDLDVIAAEIWIFGSTKKSVTPNSARPEPTPNALACRVAIRSIRQGESHEAATSWPA